MCNILSVLLILSTLSVIDASIFSKFGCKFKNDEYDLYETSSDPNILTFGKSEELKLKNETDFNFLYETVSAAFVHVHENTVFNSIENFIAFYDDWLEFSNSIGGRCQSLNDKSKAFKDYFNSYNAKVYEHSPAVGMTLDVVEEIIKRLTKKWPSISNSVHVSAVQSPSDLAELQSGSLDPKVTFKHVDFSVATIVFNLADISGKLLKGYVLIDVSGNVIKLPMVVMHDNSSKNLNIVQKNTYGDPITYQCLNKDCRYIVGKGKKTTTLLEHLIYAEGGCCSYRIIEKFHLLRPTRSIIKRNSKGEDIAGISYSIAIREKQFLTIFKVNDGMRVERKLSLNYVIKILKEKTQSNFESKLVRQVSSILEYSTEDLLDTLNRISQIRSDSDFLENVHFKYMRIIS